MQIITLVSVGGGLKTHNQLHTNTVTPEVEIFNI